MRQLKTILCFLWIIVFINGAPLKATLFLQDDEDQLKIMATFTHNGEDYFLRNTEPGDAKYYVEILTDPICVEKYRDAGVYTKEGATLYYLNHLQKWKKRNPWASYLLFKAPGEFIGHIAFFLHERKKSGEIAISYAFLPKHWGKGLGGAAVKNLIDQVVPHLQSHFIIDGYHVEQILGIVREDNPASWKILKANGFTKEEKGEEKHGTWRDFYVRKLERAPAPSA